MDFLYKLFSDKKSQAIEINRRLIYKQISLCCQDVSVTKVPILKQNAGVTLVILKAVKAIKHNKREFQELAHHAADLIVGIWRSYKKAKVPEQWLSPPLRDILRGLLGNLDSMRIFVEEQVSTNRFFRLMYNAIDMKQINRYHQRLTVTLDKFEIQSHITTNRLLIQLLENQKQISNQMKERKGVKDVVVKRITDKKSKSNSKKASSLKRRSIRVSSRAGLNRATRKSAKNINRKAGRHSPNPSSQFEWLSEDEESHEEDEVLSSITPWKIRSSMNVALPLHSGHDWPWSADARHTTGNWTLPSSPAVTFSTSGRNVIINPRVGNVFRSDFLNTANKRSAHYHC